ncbi:MAG TPA: DDE-type integrase/transposase/recombinase [Mycobacterium sp.]|nr:DDE-type integrase/transposase/recombinase [Mycobacterium sp.]
MARYQLEGEGALQPRSRRPHTSPTRLPQPTIDLIVKLRNDLLSKGLDHGPHTIAWHLQHHHGLVVSVNSIHRHLRAAGLVTPTPQRRPKSSYVWFAAEQPNERWQADFTHWWLADGTHVEILDWIDDHARYALSVTVHRRVTGPIVLAEFRKAVAVHGVPASTLTDNGMAFTTRLSGGKGGRNGFENELRRLGVTQINSTPNHPPPAARWNDSTKPSKMAHRPTPRRQSGARNPPACHGGQGVASAHSDDPQCPFLSRGRDHDHHPSRVRFPRRGVGGRRPPQTRSRRHRRHGGRGGPSIPQA